MTADYPFDGFPPEFVDAETFAALPEDWRAPGIFEPREDGSFRLSRQARAAFAEVEAKVRAAPEEADRAERQVRRLAIDISLRNALTAAGVRAELSSAVGAMLARRWNIEASLPADDDIDKIQVFASGSHGRSTIAEAVRAWASDPEAAPYLSKPTDPLRGPAWAAIRALMQD